MSRCEDCMKTPRHPDKKCCFNCGRSGTNCEVWHNCGEDCPGWDERVKTNADRIRAMSDEELAWELMTWRIETEAKHHGIESNYPNTKSAILEWLQQPVEVDPCT